jgi:hypothetical protein
LSHVVIVCHALVMAAALPAAEPATLREMIDAAVDSCQVYAGPDEQDPAKPLVVLRWANNARGSEDGTTVLYTHQGRPVAAACLYPWEGKLIHDFEAIARHPAIARRDGRVVWEPQKSGVVYADIPDAPAPESTRAGRLRQMKSLAEQFDTTLVGWKADNTDREELRLLPRPLYRYEADDPTEAKGAIVDGAVFAFVMGTDPETLLLIEAVDDGNTTKWQYAFARRTSGELEGRLDGRIVWTAPRYPVDADPRLPHFSLRTPIPRQLLSDIAGKETKSP